MSFFASDALAADTTAATSADAALADPAFSADKLMMDNLLLLAALFFIFYFILLRPQHQRIKAHRELLAKLEKNQKVITSGGLIGTISKFEGENVVVLEIAQGVKVSVSRSSISEVYVPEKSSGKSANDN